MSFDGMRRPSFSQANVQIAGASELMSPASEPNTLVVPVCALVPTPDGGHGMYVSVSGASPFLFIPVTLVERGAALEGAPVRDDGEEVARVTHSGQVPYSEFDVCEQPAQLPRPPRPAILGARGGGGDAEQQARRRPRSVHGRP